MTLIAASLPISSIYVGGWGQAQIFLLSYESSVLGCCLLRKAETIFSFNSPSMVLFHQGYKAGGSCEVGTGFLCWAFQHMDAHVAAGVHVISQ